MYCICCKKNIIKPLSNLSGNLIDEESTLWLEEEKENPMTGDKYYYTINNQMVGNGIINIIDAGYGSKHDGDQIIVALCDECIDENLEDGTVLYFDNYIFIVNFIKHQNIANPKIKQGITRAIELLPDKIKDSLFIDYESLSISYGYPIDNLSHLNSNSNSNTNINSNTEVPF
jgi:hypothetical protein